MGAVRYEIAARVLLIFIVFILIVTQGLTGHLDLYPDTSITTADYNIIKPREIADYIYIKSQGSKLFYYLFLVLVWFRDFGSGHTSIIQQDLTYPEFFKVGYLRW